jgi:cytochrome c peroxidase
MTYNENSFIFAISNEICMLKSKIFLTSLVILSALFLLPSFVNHDVKDLDIHWLRKVYSTKPSKEWPKPFLSNRVNDLTFVDLGVLPPVKYPEDNLYSKEKSDLGKLLFFDPRLSKSGQIACANCHNPELAWTDNLTRSFGHDRQNGDRNAMTILNSAYATTLFWDGRAKSLEEQASFPISDPVEMNQHLNLAVEKINSIKGYSSLFEKAFDDKKVNLTNIKKAIATFERSIVSRNNSKFDLFISGNSDLFTDQEVTGLHLFRTKANCINCHNTPYFSDNQFHNDGQALFGSKNEDLGLYNITKNKSDLGKFRTPTLREVSRTGPWMHHGHMPSLLDVVQFYNLGNPSPIQKKYLGIGRDSLIPEPSTMLFKLNLTKEEELALVAFLNTLSTKTERMAMPPLPQ